MDSLRAVVFCQPRFWLAGQQRRNQPTTSFPLRADGAMRVYSVRISVKITSDPD
jgi:hypothetical protein